MKWWRVLCVALIVVATVVPGYAASPVPLPDDISIVPPDSSVPQDLALFSGKWGHGRWDGVLDHILVVEQVSRTEARAVYAYGVAPLWNIFQSGWQRVVGEFTEKGELRLVLRNGAAVTYWFKRGKLKGEYERRGNYSAVTLEKIE